MAMVGIKGSAPGTAHIAFDRINSNNKGLAAEFYCY